MENENASNSSVKSWIDEFPIDNIIETAEAVAPLIPGIGTVLHVIIKIAKWVKVLKPAASGVAGFVSDSIDKSTDDKRAVFDRMWTIAMDDDVITPEEKEFLRPHAQAAGISNEEFELMVINKKNIH